MEKVLEATAGGVLEAPVEKVLEAPARGVLEAPIEKVLEAPMSSIIIISTKHLKLPLFS